MTCIKSFFNFGLPQILSSPASAHHRLSNQHHTYVHVPIQTDHPPRPQLQILSHFFFQNSRTSLSSSIISTLRLLSGADGSSTPLLAPIFLLQEQLHDVLPPLPTTHYGESENLFLINRNISRQTDRKYRPTTFISVYTIVPLCTHTSSCVKCRPTPTLLPESYFA